MRVFSTGFGCRSTPGPKLGRWRGPGAGGPGYPGIQNTDSREINYRTCIGANYRLYCQNINIGHCYSLVHSYREGFASSRARTTQRFWVMKQPNKAQDKIIILKPRSRDKKLECHDYHEGKTSGSVLHGLVYAHECALLVKIPYPRLVVRCWCRNFIYITAQLETQREGYDEHSSKSSLSCETKVYQTSRRKNQISEGWFPLALRQLQTMAQKTCWCFAGA
jgi:hypothetical protein